MATTHEIRPFYPVSGGDDADFGFRNRPQASAQTFLAGAVLTETTGGAVQEAGANPTPILGVATAPAAGYDWEYNTLGTVVPTMPVALATSEFRGTYLADAIPSVSALVGTTVGITKHATGYWVVDGAKTSSNQRVRITGAEGADGDSNVPVTFVFLEANRMVIA